MSVQSLLKYNHGFFSHQEPDKFRAMHTTNQNPYVKPPQQDLFSLAPLERSVPIDYEFQFPSFDYAEEPLFFRHSNQPSGNNSNDDNLDDTSMQIDARYFDLASEQASSARVITTEYYEAMKEEHRKRRAEEELTRKAAPLSISSSSKPEKKQSKRMIQTKLGTHAKKLGDDGVGAHDKEKKKRSVKKQNYSLMEEDGIELDETRLTTDYDSAALTNFTGPRNVYNKRPEVLKNEICASAWERIQDGIAKQHSKMEKVRRKRKEQCKKKASLCHQEQVKRAHQIMEAEDEALTRSRKLFGKLASHFKKNEAKNAEQRRKKMELERENQRKSKKLNYLITRTELYSHFMAKRIGDEVGDVNELLAMDPDGNDDEGSSGLLHDVQKAISESDTIMKNFDFSANQHRKGQSLEDPNGTDQTHEFTEPHMFVGKLKEYQRGGLNWLINLYDQGINGILADEMGLGKTVQTIAFLAHLAERKGIWGPFLVIAPKSTLPNWCREVQQFCNGTLKVLPYWGSIKQRKILRKVIHPNLLYSKHAPFHVLVTSYQTIVTDKSIFGKIKWEYMVLDEAQAIKSAHSQRWKTMLTLLKDCRNRLLLTGTPIQNNMGELWALLHFIMPTLFDNHQEFADWFSKDIESHAENKASNVNQHQLHRLYLVLKPFMLRREKKDVADEMPKKTEIEVKCQLTARQEQLYNGIKQKLSIADLLDQAKNAKNVKSLMNLVMQFRKVCNHPELLERKEATYAYHFAEPVFSSLLLRDTYWLRAPCRNPISYTLPRLVYEEALFPTALNMSLCSGMRYSLHRKILFNMFSIFTRRYIASSLAPPVMRESDAPESDCWSFLRFCDYSPSEVEQCWSLDNSFARWSLALELISRFQSLRTRNEIYEDSSNANSRFLITELNSPVSVSGVRNSLFLSDIVKDPVTRMEENLVLLSTTYIYKPKVLAPVQTYLCNSNAFALQQLDLFHNRYMTAHINGVCHFTGEYSPDNNCTIPLFETDASRFESREHGTLAYTLLEEGRRVVSSDSHSYLPPIQSQGLGYYESKRVGSSFISTVDFGELVRESSKMKILARLLNELKRQKHRVLIYSQMTSMLDILEDFLSAHSFKFVRLDGSCGLDQRQEMVDAFQNTPSIFCFLLSTRAGGLGINLTAADTVIFYDSDWNPTIDSQAMDRSHRIGQTRPVTVYRLITSNTVEARILERAKQKNRIQTMVMTGECEMNDEKIWGSTEMVDLLMQDGVGQNVPDLNTKKRRQPTGFTIPKHKREKKVAKKENMEDVTNNKSQMTLDGVADSTPMLTFNNNNSNNNNSNNNNHANANNNSDIGKTLKSLKVTVKTKT